MKQKVDLIAAPTAMQPGGYMAKAYADRVSPGTKSAEIEVVELNGTWTVTVQWHAPKAVIDASDNARLFVDGCALFVPTVKDAPWISMGSPDMPLEGVLWRADKPDVMRVGARGLGTVERGAAPAGWAAVASHSNGAWRVTFTLADFKALAQVRQLAFAIWQGAQSERAGLKSVSPGWVAV